MKISLARISTKNLATLAKRSIETSVSGKYPVMDGNPLLAKLQATYTLYEQVYAKETYSGKGKDVAAADELRDQLYSNLRAFLDGYRRISSVPNYDMAETLYQIFVKYGLELPRLSYAEQTAQMLKLLEELDGAENQSKITTLHLKTAYDEMKAAHLAFEATFADQSASNAELRNQSSASALRRSLEADLRVFLGFVTNMKEIPGWEIFYNDLNELAKAAKKKDVKNNNENPQ